jgi:hypothetical protein
MVGEAFDNGAIEVEVEFVLAGGGGRNGNGFFADAEFSASSDGVK